MLRKSPSKALSTLLLCLLTFPPRSFAATGQGSVSLWSNSDCAKGDTLAFTEPVVISLNKTLDADTCGNLPREAHSYRVDRRPTCANGSTAGFAYYGGHNCQVKGFGGAFNSIGQAGESTEFDGLCLALVTFASVAFICDGIGAGNTFSTAVVTSTDSSEPSSAPSTELPPVNIPTTDLPVVSTLSATTPPYTYSSTLAGFSAALPGTQPASVILPSGTGGFLPPLPSPSPFTGAASGIKVSILSLIFAFGLGVAT